MPVFDQDTASAARDRRVTIAQSDTGQSARVANLLPRLVERRRLRRLRSDRSLDARPRHRRRYPDRDPDDRDPPRILVRVRLRAAMRAAGRRLAAVAPVRPARSRPGLADGA